jgi:hypothetical protein
VTFGFLQGRSDYEPEPGVPNDYVGHGFKRFREIEIGRDRLKSVGLLPQGTGQRQPNYARSRQ